MERNNDDHHQYYQKYVKSDTMMILSIGIGVFYFIYIICWIKVQFHLVENEDFSPKSTLRNRNRTKKNSTTSDQSKASTPFGHQEAMLDEESKRGQNSPLAVPEGGPPTMNPANRDLVGHPASSSSTREKMLFLLLVVMHFHRLTVFIFIGLDY